MQRTAAGLREILFEQIEGVKSGQISAADAKAVAAVAGTILKSVEVEMAFRAQQRELAAGGQEIGELPLAALPEPEAPHEAPKPAPLAAPTASRVVKGRAYGS